MPSNAAAWITAAKASPLEVKEAPYPSPGPEEVVVRTAAVAINPMDFKLQDHDHAVGGRRLRYPTILGCDVAGTVVATGGGARQRGVGDRVMAHAHGVSAGRPECSAFQRFVVLPAAQATPLPDGVPFEAAAVLPLACDTAMAGLFARGQLGLSTARLGGDGDAAAPAPGSALLVWGGSSSVGCCAVQMARAAGYEVVTTASGRNHGLCRALGASAVFDHADGGVEEAIAAALAGRTVAGALDCIADNDKTAPACARILARASGRRKLVSVLAPPETGLAEGVEAQRGESTSWMRRGLQLTRDRSEHSGSAGQQGA